MESRTSDKVLGIELAHFPGAGAGRLRKWLSLSRKVDIRTSDEVLGTELAHFVRLSLSHKVSGSPNNLLIGLVAAFEHVDERYGALA